MSAFFLAVGGIDMSDEIMVPMSDVAEMLIACVNGRTIKSSGVFSADDAPPNKPIIDPAEDKNVKLDDTNTEDAIQAMTKAVGDATEDYTTETPADTAGVKAEDSSRIKLERESEAVPSATSVKAHAANVTGAKLIDTLLKLSACGKSHGVKAKAKKKKQIALKVATALMKSGALDKSAVSPLALGGGGALAGGLVGALHGGLSPLEDKDTKLKKILRHAIVGGGAGLGAGLSTDSGVREQLGDILSSIPNL